jgi:hypothetical protein
MSSANPFSTQNLDWSHHSSEDALREIALQEGIQAVEKDAPEEVSLQFTDSEATMLKKLTSSLALSVKVVVESAISYVYFYTKNRGLRIEQLPEYPDELGTTTLKLALAAETTHKLDELGMTQKLSECAVTGVRLLYHQLIEKVHIGT